MPHSFDNAQQLLRTVPATLVLIAMSMLGYLLYLLFTMGAPIGIIGLFTYDDFMVTNNQVSLVSREGQYWRYLTPIFLHFGLIHVVFNCLWTWELGALIERHLGASMLLPLVLVCGVGSNVAQASFGGGALFGGMSGVVYALLGFCWVYSRLMPRRRLQVPQPVVLVMLGWLVFCFVAPTELLGLGSIANASHLAGFLLGCASGAAIGAWHRVEEGRAA